eukprot:jgi/Tetstr1/456284/TSEL_043041.t1
MCCQIVEKKMLEARVVAPTQNISHKLADVHDFPAVKAFLENVDKEISDRNKLWVPEMEAWLGRQFKTDSIAAHTHQLVLNMHELQVHIVVGCEIKSSRRRRRPPEDPAIVIAFEAAQTSVDSVRQAIATARLHADMAATSALLAAATEAICKAAKPKATRRRGAAAVAPRASLLDITNCQPTADA